eukprot:3265236-Alexandrium_andersonii.AAC.1
MVSCSGLACGFGDGEVVFPTMQHSCCVTSGLVPVSGVWAGSGRFRAMRLVDGWACGSPAGMRARAVFVVRRRR